MTRSKFRGANGGCVRFIRCSSKGLPKGARRGRQLINGTSLQKIKMTKNPTAGSGEEGRKPASKARPAEGAPRSTRRKQLSKKARMDDRGRAGKTEPA